MCTNVYICTSECVCMNMCVPFMCLCMCTFHLSVYVCIRMCICMLLCMLVFVCVCVHARACVYVCAERMYIFYLVCTLNFLKRNLYINYYVHRPATKVKAYLCNTSSTYFWNIPQSTYTVWSLHLVKSAN